MYYNICIEEIQDSVSLYLISIFMSSYVNIFVFLNPRLLPRT